ncbi:D-alanyl-D-alanine carboxypeptidase family protein [Sinanaerobacter sp. ZZT-01]|uniref:D-alanyl-D-alanine carboxypeptidase family protein n=1 Tax=Sinanaerobacter sp. ZZT-01 TaxID=3111540 RepID=UPI002D767BEB|nr:D-alanyl-D-alanine carboxypeptidase family protein [Sinanaerobacter sp. ZZT-01]WRR94845.1 D-alanyl-D-alanine carboxypeptidase family protein [Sinanaerobacter sp. ZZT-01]
MNRKIIRTTLSLMLILTLFCGMTTFAFAGSSYTAVPKNVAVVMDDKTENFAGYNVGGQNYFRLRDFAELLNGSEKQFNITYDNQYKAIQLWKGKAYTANGEQKQVKNLINKEARSISSKLLLDNKRIKFTAYSIEGESYFRFCDIMQIFDVYAAYDYSAEAILIDPKKDYTVQFQNTVESGYFDFLHGALLGNSDTGEILYSNNSDQKVSIASTSKLMTYLLIREAVKEKKISWDDEVVLSKTAEAYSLSEDGVVPMKAGQKVKLQDLVEAMLIVSSNESATALAEHLYGSEEKFTQRMNQRASELGLLSAEFYNPHGLPIYTPDVLSSKKQNRMSAKDLFELSRYIINHYPEVLAITEKVQLSEGSLNFTDENTNRLLFQMDGVDGLKTGTTNRAGCCLIATMPVKNGAAETRIIAIVLGAEDSTERAEKTGVLLQYGEEYYSQ